MRTNGERVPLAIMSAMLHRIPDGALIGTVHNLTLLTAWREVALWAANEFECDVTDINLIAGAEADPDIITISGKPRATCRMVRP